jgi:hypothetical protein
MLLSQEVDDTFGPVHALCGNGVVGCAIVGRCNSELVTSWETLILTVIETANSKVGVDWIGLPVVLRGSADGVDLLAFAISACVVVGA